MDPFTPALAASLAAQWPGQRFTASVYDERSGCQFDLRPDLRLTTASVLKVEVMAGILLRAQSQGRPLSAQEQSLIEPMITQSHDAPTNVLWQSLGGAAGMTALDNVFGLTDTTQIGPQWGVTVTSARDQVHLLRQVLVGDFGPIGPAYRADALYYMTHVIPAQRWGITAGVPAGWTVANKNGFASSVCCVWRINSTGVVYDPSGGGYVIAILSDHWPDQPTGVAAVETVSRAVAAKLAQPVAATGPSQAEAGNGARYAFWKGTDGNLQQAIWNGSAWTGPYDIGMGPLGSEPTSGIDGNGSTSALWRGADGNLWEAHWAGTAWAGPVNLKMGRLGSAPSVAVTAGGIRYVFWQGTDGNVWEAIGTGSDWGGPYDIGMGPIGSAPAAGVDSHGNTYVFWRGQDGNLWTGYWTGSGWSGARLVGMGPLGSQPSVAVTASATQYVFWKGPDGGLWEAIGGAGQPWTGPYNQGMGVLGSGPSAAVDGGGATSAVWKGGDGFLWQAFWNGSRWAGPSLVGVGPIG
jgi:hypothetical protein